MRIARSATAISALLCSLALTAAPARASDLYLQTELGISSATGQADSTNTFGPSSGSGQDASPVYGAGLGLGFALNEALPWGMRIPRFAIPYWPGRALRYAGSEDARFPDWDTRFEIEWLTGRDWEISSSGVTAGLPYRSDVSASTVMAKLRLDIPLQAPINALFGRLPVLEPLALYGSGGVGMAMSEIRTSDSIVSGDEENIGLAYQGGAGLGYRLTERIHWSVGWRYLGLGETTVPLSDGQIDRGEFSMDVGAHEFITGLRFDLWRLPTASGE